MTFAISQFLRISIKSYGTSTWYRKTSPRVTGGREWCSNTCNRHGLLAGTVQTSNNRARPVQALNKHSCCRSFWRRHLVILRAILHDPWVYKHVFQGKSLVGIKEKQLDMVRTTLRSRPIEGILTRSIRSLAWGLMNEGTDISALVISRCVRTGVSSNGASPTRNSYNKTPRD